jgi:hypothetical protein
VRSAGDGGAPIAACDLDAAVAPECLAQKAPVFREHLGIGVAQLLGAGEPSMSVTTSVTVPVGSSRIAALQDRASGSKIKDAGTLSAFGSGPSAHFSQAQPRNCR